MAAVMSVRLASFGYEVTIAEHGEAAVAQFAQLAPDLILMDIEMPVMNGFEATARIRAIEATQDWAWTPILFLTASDTQENLITAIEAGGDDFLVKSVAEAVLQAKMKAMTRIAALRKRLSVANRLLKEQASRDGLTGLSNRRHMDLTLDLAWSEARESGRPFALLMLDIDHFKKYNDRYGHQAGDRCLASVAGALRSHIHRATDLVARYGGEEFAVLLPDTDASGARYMAEHLLRAVATLGLAHEASPVGPHVTLSIGASTSRSHDRGPRPADSRLGGLIKPAMADLVAAADQALYAAKEGGRRQARYLSVDDLGLPGRAERVGDVAEPAAEALRA